MTTTERASRGLVALRAYVAGRGEAFCLHELDAEAIDLVTDVLHYAAANGANPMRIVRCARDHFIEETHA